MRHARLNVRAALCALMMTAVFPAESVAQQSASVDASTRDPSSEWHMLGFAQLFTRYATYVREDTDVFQAFELQRAELGTGFLYKERHGFVVNVEAIRSAGPRSTFGIDDNSLVLRVKQAFAMSAPDLPFGTLIVRAGVIPDVWVEVVEQSYDLRAVSALGSERSGLYASSDLGASMSYAIFDERLELRISFANGEGRQQVELNAGKNSTLVLSARQPLFSWRGQRARAAFHASWRDGSTGFSSLASHRLAAALTFEHPSLFAGAEIVRAQGHSGVGSLVGNHIGVWANAAPVVSWAGLYVKAQRFTPNIDLDAHRTIGHGGVYADLIPPTDAPRNVLGFPRLRLYLGYEGTFDDEEASPIAGSPDSTNQHALTLTLSARASAAIAARAITPSPLDKDKDNEDQP